MSAHPYPILLFLHVAGVVVWVGGMLFAHQCLRPAAAQLLEAPQRLRLWRAVLGRFFAWVWVAMLATIASGLAILLPVGFPSAPMPWHLMVGLAMLMTAIFLYVYFVPYAALRGAVGAEDWSRAGVALARIRKLVGTNLAIGSVTIAVATLGRFYE